MTDVLKTRILWLLLLLSIAGMFLGVAGFTVTNVPLATGIELLPAVVIVLYVAWTLGVLRGGVLFGLAGIIGWFFEFLGLRYGTFFGGNYVYAPGMATFYGVPIAVVVYWATFVCIGYAIGTSFLYWVGKDKPVASKHELATLISVVLLDGLVVTALDLFMDPIMVKQAAWRWLAGGMYFGVPLGNFVGWFTIAVLATGIFRLWEYFSPRLRSSLDSSIFLVPVFSYLMGAVVFLVAAWELKMGLFVFVGGIAMSTVVGANLYLYAQYIRTRRSLDFSPQSSSLTSGN